MSVSEKPIFIRRPTARSRLPLHSVTRGSRLIVVEIPEGRSRIQLIRLGVLEGEMIKCIERMPGGTVVIEKNRQEIAIGAALARTILVERLHG
jgi:Fe2+ transport system protein FeoA